MRVVVVVVVSVVVLTISDDPLSLSLSLSLFLFLSLRENLNEKIYGSAFFILTDCWFRNVRGKTRPNTRHKMRLIGVFYPSKITRDIRTYGTTDRRTDGRTRPNIEMRRRI